MHMNVSRPNNKLLLNLLLYLMLTLPIQQAFALCEKRTDGSVCHKHLVDKPFDFLRADLHAFLKRAVLFPDDNKRTAYRSAEHFDSCNFDGGISNVNTKIAGASGALALFSPNGTSEANVFAGIKKWAAALHGIQDFYAHSNWVEMTRSEAIYGVSILPVNELVDDGLGLWNIIKDDWQLVRPNIISSQTNLPATWTFDKPVGDSNFNDRLTRIKDDSNNEYWLLISGQAGSLNKCPVHKSSGGKVTKLSMSHDDLHKDNINRRFHLEAQLLAQRQTRHEWCRLMHLTRDTRGLPAVSVMMGLMVEPGKSPHMPDTSCEALLPAPIDVTVSVDRIKVLNDHNTLAAPGDLNFTLSLYTTNLQRSERSQGRKVVVNSMNDVPAFGRPKTISLCVAANEQVVTTVQGWEDDDKQNDWKDKDINGEFTRADDVLVGTTHTIGSGENIVQGNNIGQFTLTSDNPNIKDIEVDITVSNVGIDEDGDGLTLCQEQAANTNPTLADTDGDGRNDGDEIAMGYDPLVSDFHMTVPVNTSGEFSPLSDQSPTANVCTTKNTKQCTNFGASCDAIHAIDGTKSDVCRWSENRSSASCKRTAGIWTLKSSKYATKHPDAVLDGDTGACITEVKNLKALNNLKAL